MAILEGLLQIDKRFKAYPELLDREVVVESDIAVVIKLISREDEDHSEISLLIDKVREKAKLTNTVSFAFCQWSCNLLAHSLARAVVANNDLVFWAFDPSLSSRMDGVVGEGVILPPWFTSILEDVACVPISFSY